MLFTTPSFIFLFVPISLVGYFYLNKTNHGKLWLITCSLFFYSYWKIKFLPLLLSSIFFNFLAGSFLCRNNSREAKKIIITLSVALNLTLLLYFKYTNFFITNINYLTNSQISNLDIALPLGISFFTFTQIAFLVDCYTNKVSEYSFGNYALFVTYFPHLIAGPILHHSEMMPQFNSDKNKKISYENILWGLFIFSVGFFKKTIIADYFSIYANSGFDTKTTFDLYSAWATSLSYTFQIYFDFSGYTDMAIGLSLLFNIKLPINFNSPYKSLNIQDFWRRWHITLSRFLRDYLYIPMGGNRCSEVKVTANLITTFILGGLWHGANWMFVIWGGLHGMALAVHRFFKIHNFIILPSYLSWFITFNFINITWIFFRADNISVAKSILKGMFGLGPSYTLEANQIDINSVAWGGQNIDILLRFLPGSLVENFLCICAIIFAFLIISTKNFNDLTAKQIDLYKILLMVLLFTISIHKSLISKSTIFLYFNF